MSWEYLFLAAVATMAIVLVLFRNNPLVEKYWVYALILVPAAALVIMSLVVKRRGATTTTDSVARTIAKVKDDLTEANMTAAVKMSAANQQNKDKVEQLAEVKKIDDQAERLKRLAELMP